MLLCTGAFLFAQNNSKNCECPANKFAPTEPQAVFQFSSGESIALCGYKVDDDNRKLFSEFVLTVCGSGTLIDFWDASLLCEVRSVEDTLFIEQIASLPIGVDFAQQDVAWLIEKITMNEGELHRTLQLNREVRKYEPSEINDVLVQYEKADSIPNEYNMTLAGRLLIATISGNEKARKYFMQFRERFGILDGAFSQEYHFLQTMLEAWDSDKEVVY
ncbi:hypothetical protein DI53_3315 [Sphingobacterium deserti]|uniref:Uncharacterized protein n=2 Tax=Sphingobacterium deserti TaxID=1229276 RepID=A0A0B8T264_9SPHI|nr:hypothetical protein DI53_3315 [Sphingobacterium deserti]